MTKTQANIMLGVLWLILSWIAQISGRKNNSTFDLAMSLIFSFAALISFISALAD